MAYSSDPEAFLTGDDKIISEAKRRFRYCEEWEANARNNFEYDYKFVHGDSVNNYQWDNWVVGDRALNERPCLTINETKSYCLQIINDGRQNKPGINIRPVGGTASFEAAQIFNEVVRHIEYISNAEAAYDNASEFQVYCGIGYWHVTTDYLDDNSDDQEIFIRRIKDPRSVYLDPDINEIDGSDATFGFIFTDLHRDVFNAKYPNDLDAYGSGAFDNNNDGWYTKDHIRVAKYYRKTMKQDARISFVLPETQELVEGLLSEMPTEAKTMFREIKKRESNLPYEMQTYRERKLLSGKIEVFKIAGNKIIDRSNWLGKYIPIVRIIGEETVIDGVMDRCGHVRALLDPQRIYNISASTNVELTALQPKAPFMAATAAIEGYEEYYRTGNTVAHSYMPYNQYDEDGNKLDRPERAMPPQANSAYPQLMELSRQQMMMASGQFQSQRGENENAKSGVAINARQRQGDRATYQYPDGQARGINFTGKILIDLIPKIYDTKRIMQIEAKDGTIINLTVDPEAPEALTKVLGEEPSQSNENIVNMIFNPNVGTYGVMADTGPSFATRRQEAFNALTQIAAQNKEFMNIGGDLLWKVADFPEAQLLAQRWRRVIPPNILGDAPNPQMTQAMEQASQQIEQMQGELAKLVQEAQDRTRELDIKQGELNLKATKAGHDATIEAVREIREDFKALNERFRDVGNAGPAFSIEQLQPIIKNTIAEALANAGVFGEDATTQPGINEGGTSVVPTNEEVNETR